MKNHAIAVKAFILDNNQLLMLERRPNDPHRPGKWDLLGGRLDGGENPYKGMQREVLEEAGIRVDIHAPIDVHHFVRDDGQQITMIFFLCTPRSKDVKLSEEHTNHDWRNLDTTNKWLNDDLKRWIGPVLENIKTYNLA